MTLLPDDTLRAAQQAAIHRFPSFLPVYQVLLTTLQLDYPGQDALPLRLECPDLASALASYERCAAWPGFTCGTLELWRRLPDNSWTLVAGERRAPNQPSQPYTTTTTARP